jgi:hypothetical protein
VLDPVLCVLLSRSGNKVRGVAAAAIVAEVLNLETFRDGFDPELVCGAVRDLAVPQCFDPPIAVFGMALP